ncbi:MAG: GNAT family N-acetyltransferase [Clostridia bacterium]|nr:GNAT family N-acetyltransferase [Clostridia bacterium]
MSLTVRRAEERDIPAVMELLKQVNRVHYDGRPDLFKLATKYSEDDLRAIFKNEKTPVFVCCDGEGRVLGHGFCVLQRPENVKLMRDVLTLYIDDICVDASARGKHVGSAIYHRILDFAREKGCYNVTLNVWSCNPGAIKFYEKLGLVPYKIGMETVL